MFIWLHDAAFVQKWLGLFMLRGVRVVDLDVSMEET